MVDAASLFVLVKPANFFASDRNAARRDGAAPPVARAGPQEPSPRDAAPRDERRQSAPREDAPRRRKTDRPPSRAARWGGKLLPETFDRLREHPVFVLDDLHSGAHPEGAAATGTFAGQLLRENDLEPLYQLELLRIFRTRMRLAAGIGLVFLPLFTAFTFFLSPHTSLRLVGMTALLMLVLAGVIGLCGAVHRLTLMRILALATYVVFCGGAGLLISVVTRGAPLGDEATRGVQLVVLASFIQVLLSILLLPFSLFEATIAALITIAAVAWGMSLSNASDSRLIYLSQLFVIGTTAALVLTISHLSSVLRRRAFRSSFDLALQAARMQEMSATDSLTGGFNRRYVEAHLAIELARARRFGHALSLLMFDLDNFKPVNDTLGHAAGDQVLRAVWQASAASLREVDTLSRFGGDEFLIVLPETGPTAAHGIAERLRAAVSTHLLQTWGPDALEGRVTLSMGVLTLSEVESLTVEGIIERVDALLYSAKRAGKNRTAVQG